MCILYTAKRIDKPETMGWRIGGIKEGSSHVYTAKRIDIRIDKPETMGWRI